MSTEPFVSLPRAHAARRVFGTTTVTSFRGSTLSLGGEATHFGFVFDGRADICCESGSYRLRAGMYFSVPGALAVEGVEGSGFVVTHAGFTGFFQLGGPIEPEGRLRYIDGCTDSVLVPPIVVGQPCLNHLHIPAATAQSRHTHPSLRVGMIARGRGRCVLSHGAVALSPGLVFAIVPDELHSFFTDDSPLDVVVYHPDSDTGPTHEDHPMLNRTILSPGR